MNKYTIRGINPSNMTIADDVRMTDGNWFVVSEADLDQHLRALKNTLPHLNSISIDIDRTGQDDVKVDIYYSYMGTKSRASAKSGDWLSALEEAELHLFEKVGHKLQELN